MSAALAEEADVPTGYRRCANPQCANPIQVLANFPRMGRGLSRYCETCWNARKGSRQIVRIPRAKGEKFAPGHLSSGGPLVLQRQQPESEPIIEPGVAEAIRLRVRQIAGDAAREIADETVCAYLAAELEPLVRRVVRDIARETITQAVRTLFGGLEMESEAK